MKCDTMPQYVHFLDGNVMLRHGTSPLHDVGAPPLVSFVLVRLRCVCVCVCVHTRVRVPCTCDTLWRGPLLCVSPALGRNVCVAWWRHLSAGHVRRLASNITLIAAHWMYSSCCGCIGVLLLVGGQNAGHASLGLSVC